MLDVWECEVCTHRVVEPDVRKPHCSDCGRGMILMTDDTTMRSLAEEVVSGWDADDLIDYAVAAMIEDFIKDEEYFDHTKFEHWGG